MIGETIPTNETPENYSEIPSNPSEPTREQNENLGERAMDFLTGYESEQQPENNNNNSSEASNTDLSEEETDELTPEQIEWREGHTDEEIDALADTWDAWAGHDLGFYHGQILSDMFYDKKLGWKFTDFKDFFDNDYEARFKTERDKDFNSVTSKLCDSLNTMKQVLGEESPEYSSAVRKIFVDIRNGKYKGSRLKYDGYFQGEIIFANQEEAIKRDDEDRREAKEEEDRQREEWIKKREEAWEKSWRNPNNDAAYKKNIATIDQNTLSYLGKILFNLDTIAPAARETVMNAINQNILEGTFNGAYLDSYGDFHIGETAEEYRGYDQNRNRNNPDENEPPASPITRPNTGHKKPETKSPEDFGYRDWNN